MRLFIPNPPVAIMIKDKHFKCQASKILLEKKKIKFYNISFFCNNPNFFYSLQSHVEIRWRNVAGSHAAITKAFMRSPATSL